MEKKLYCFDLLHNHLLPWLQTKNYFIFNCWFNLTCYYATAGIPPGICSFFCSWWSTHHPRACRKRQFPIPELLINLIHVFWGYIFSRAKLISINFSKLMGWVWFLSQGPHSHILVTGRSEGFFWVWHSGQKGFFWVYERSRDFFGSRKQHRDFFGYFFSSAQINNSISAIYSFVFDQNQSWSWHVLAFQKINNKICWCKNTEGFFWVC